MTNAARRLRERREWKPMKATTVEQPVRERVLNRIRKALADGDEATAMRIARELQRRWRACDERRSAALQAQG